MRRGEETKKSKWLQCCPRRRHLLHKTPFKSQIKMIEILEGGAQPRLSYTFLSSLILRASLVLNMIMIYLCISDVFANAAYNLDFKVWLVNTFCLKLLTELMVVLPAKSAASPDTISLVGIWSNPGFFYGSNIFTNLVCSILTWTTRAFSSKARRW